MAQFRHPQHPPTFEKLLSRATHLRHPSLFLSSYIHDTAEWGSSHGNTTNRSIARFRGIGFRLIISTKTCYETTFLCRNVVSIIDRREPSGNRFLFIRSTRPIRPIYSKRYSSSMKRTEISRRSNRRAVTDLKMNRLAAKDSRCYGYRQLYVYIPGEYPR